MHATDPGAKNAWDPKNSGLRMALFVTIILISYEAVLNAEQSLVVPQYRSLEAPGKA